PFAGLPRHARHMGATEAIPGVVRYERQQPFERVQDGAVLREWLERKTLPPPVQPEHRLPGPGAGPEHRGGWKVEERQEGVGPPHAPGESLGYPAIAVPARQLRIVREHKAELILGGDLLDDHIRHRVPVAEEILPQEFTPPVAKMRIGRAARE